MWAWQFEFYGAVITDLVSRVTNFKSGSTTSIPGAPGWPGFLQKEQNLYINLKKQTTLVENCVAPPTPDIKHSI